MEGRLNECSAKFAAFMYPAVRNNALYARSCGTHIYANTKNYIFFYALISFPGYWWVHETLKRIHQAYSPWSIYSLLIGGRFKVHCLWVWATLVVCRKYSTYGGEKGKKIERQREVFWRQKIQSALWQLRSAFCGHLCGSVKWLYLAEPRVGWVRSLPLPGLSNTTPTTISVAFFYALYGASIISLTHLRNRNREDGGRIRSGMRGGNASAKG